MATPATTANTGDAYIVKVKSSIGKTYIGGIVFKNQTQLDPTQQQIIEFKRALIALNPGIMGSSLEANENQINKTLNEHVGENIIIPKSLIIGEETVNGKSTENTQTNEESHNDNPSKDPDGEKTVIETKSDGSQTVTQINKDGTAVTSEREKETVDELGNRTDVNIPSSDRITADDNAEIAAAKKEAQTKMQPDNTTVNDPKAGTAEVKELETERKAIKENPNTVLPAVSETNSTSVISSNERKNQNPSSTLTEMSSQRKNNNTPTTPPQQETKNALLSGDNVSQNNNVTSTEWKREKHSIEENIQHNRDLKKNAAVADQENIDYFKQKRDSYQPGTDMYKSYDDSARYTQYQANVRSATASQTDTIMVKRETYIANSKVKVSPATAHQILMREDPEYARTYNEKRAIEKQLAEEYRNSN